MNTENRLLGTNTDGHDVYVEITLERHDQERQTIDHQPIKNYLTLSIVGTVVEHGKNPRFDRNVISCGQINDTTPPPAGAEELWAIWARWHLNDLQSACRHQDRGAHLGPDKQWLRGQAWTNMVNHQLLKCPESYAYGSKWLVEPLPDDVIDTVCRIAGFDRAALT